jgi:4'-phosphopantetheinyl transferase EntD
VNPEDLSGEEQEILARLKNQGRSREFLAGRTAARRVIMDFCGRKDPSGICVGKGLFHEPLVKMDYAGYPGLSLAHSKGLAAALAYPRGHHLAIDLETVPDRESRREAIRRSCTWRELENLGSLLSGEDNILALVWTMKEVLSKALKCGMTVPFTLLELRDIRIGDGMIQANYTHFYQYRVRSCFLDSGHAFSIVSPRYTDISGLPGSLPGS